MLQTKKEIFFLYSQEDFSSSWLNLISEVISHYAQIECVFVDSAEKNILKRQCLLQIKGCQTSVLTLTNSEAWLELQTFLKVDSFLKKLPTQNPTLALDPFWEDIDFLKHIQAKKLITSPTYAGWDNSQKCAFYFDHNPSLSCENLYLIVNETRRPPANFKGELLFHSNSINSHKPNFDLYAGLFLSAHTRVENLFFWEKNKLDLSTEIQTPTA